MNIQIPYSPHWGQEPLHESTSRFRVLACHTRWGKDRFGVNELIRDTVKWLGESRPAELIPKVHIWIVAPNYPLSEQIWREAKEFLQPLIKMRFIRAYETRGNRSFEWKGGGLWEFKSADNPDSLVSVGLDELYVTEAARVPDEAWEMSLRPRLSSEGRKGKGIFAGTPRGKNWFHRIFVKSQDPQEKEWAGWNIPAFDDWPICEHRHPFSQYPDTVEIQKARKDMPERWFRQEWMAEFIEEGGAVFEYLSLGGHLGDPDPGKTYIAGIDLAKYVDFTVVTIMDSDGQVRWIERFRKQDWELQKQKILFILNKYHAFACIDSTGVGDPVFEDIQRHYGAVEGISITAPAKKELIDGLSIGMQEKDLMIPDGGEGKVMIQELKDFEYTLTHAGNIQFSAPKGCHDDCVVSLALAYHMKRKYYPMGKMSETETPKLLGKERESWTDRQDVIEDLGEL